MDSRSHPYKSGALKELLKSQEVSLLRDINEAIEKRVENRISTARRFAVRGKRYRKLFWLLGSLGAMSTRNQGHNVPTLSLGHPVLSISTSFAVFN
jgi:hypothetical protein